MQWYVKIEEEDGNGKIMKTIHSKALGFQDICRFQMGGESKIAR
jgi:hypothetical protein